MGLGAIVVIRSKDWDLAQRTASPASPPKAGPVPLLAGPLACIEIAGRSVAERLVERLQLAEVDFISLLVEADAGFRMPPFRGSFGNLAIEVVSDAVSAASQKLKDYSQAGIDHCFIHSASLYAETDLLDLFYFHREARQAATRAFDRDGPLSLWVLDCIKAQDADLEILLRQAGQSGATYFISNYVNRIAHPRDLRRLAVDTLRGRCVVGPMGREIRPGVWIDAGAEIHRKARIVAPAYIGCDATIREASLVTRLTNIERGCSVDCGSVVEDSSILAETHIGIWLDVCHAMVSGNRLLNLERDVTIEIADPRVMRSSGTARLGSVAGERKVQADSSIADLPQERRAPEAWLMGANLIEE